MFVAEGVGGGRAGVTAAGECAAPGAPAQASATSEAVEKAPEGDRAWGVRAKRTPLSHRATLTLHVRSSQAPGVDKACMSL